MTLPAVNNTTLNNLSPNLDIGDVADPALRLAAFNYIYTQMQAIVTELNSIPAGNLQNSSVIAAKIADLAVTTGKIADLAVTTAKLNDLSVTTAKLADLGVTAGKLALGAVGTSQIAAGAVTVDRLDPTIQNSTNIEVVNARVSVPSNQTYATLKARLDGEIGNLLKSIVTIDKMGLSNSTSLNDIATGTFSNAILNFENKELFLNGGKTLNLTNCVVINLNLKTQGFNNFVFTGSNYKIFNCTFDGSQANQNYVNYDPQVAVFRPLELDGSDFEFSYNTVKNYISTAGIYVNNADNFKIENNDITNCYSYLRVTQPGGAFDAYGDGIYSTGSTNGTIGKNRILNSVTNPIGRAGIVVEFNCYNIHVDANKVEGYDRGIHIELVLDNIYVSKNIVRACCVPLMIWNVNEAHVYVDNDNYFSDEGIDFTDALHKSILTFTASISLMAILGNYTEVTTGKKNNSNVIVRNNTFVVSSTSFYKKFGFLEGAPDCKIIKNRFINKSNVVPVISCSGDNNNTQKYYANFEDNYIEGDLYMPFMDKMKVTGNTMQFATVTSKNKANILFPNITDRLFERNILLNCDISTTPMLTNQQNAIYRGNTFYNVSSANIMTGTNADGCVFEGNTIIQDRAVTGAVNLVRFRDSHGLTETYPPTNYYSTVPNIFIDRRDLSNVIMFKVNGDGTVVSDSGDWTTLSFVNTDCVNVATLVFNNSTRKAVYKSNNGIVNFIVKFNFTPTDVNALIKIPLPPLVPSIIYAFSNNIPMGIPVEYVKDNGSKQVIATVINGTNLDILPPTGGWSSGTLGSSNVILVNIQYATKSTLLGD